MEISDSDSSSPSYPEPFSSWKSNTNACNVIATHINNNFFSSTNLTSPLDQGLAISFPSSSSPPLASDERANELYRCDCSSLKSQFNVLKRQALTCERNNLSHMSRLCSFIQENSSSSCDSRSPSILSFPDRFISCSSCSGDPNCRSKKGPHHYSG